MNFLTKFHTTKHSLLMDVWNKKWLILLDEIGFFGCLMFIADPSEFNELRLILSLL